VPRRSFIFPRVTPSFYALTLLNVAGFALLYATLCLPGLTHARGMPRLLLWLKLLLELGTSFYLFSMLMKASDYLFGDWKDIPSDPRKAPSPPPGGGVTPAQPEAARAWPPIACAYLCAGDLDARALESLCRLDYPGRLDIHLHDDAGDKRVAAAVDATVRDIALRTGRPITVWRRPQRDGGKPGAVNYLLGQIGDGSAFVLLADNDSTAVDAAALRKAVPIFDDPRVAIVQFRNVGVPVEGDGHVNRLLNKAIEVFDLFARHQSRHGMAFFFGHNGLLRTTALREAGGLRPGVFADDIDLSVRLARGGWRIQYAPEIAFGETHPISYTSFRKRAYKWAFGCGQILRAHLLPALLDRRLSFSQKLGLLEFIGFYAMQTLLIAYLVLIGLVLPLVSGPPPVGAVPLFLGGSAIVAAILLPSFAYYARRRRMAEWWPFALVCTIVYGSVAFSTARGLLDGTLGRQRRWIPTNVAGARTGVPAVTILESGFGFLLFMVPALWAPMSLWQPSLYLFATVFLLSPFAALAYAPAGGATVLSDPLPFLSRLLSRRPVPVLVPGGGGFRRRRALLVVLLGGACLAPFLLSFHGHASTHPVQHVAIQGDAILLDDHPFQVKGVQYSPWLPGTGPEKDYPWPGDDVVSRDLGMISSLGANTILVHDAPRSILSQARRQGLMVVYAYYINWQSIGDDAAFRKRTDEIVKSASGLAGDPNLLAILLGNEVVEWVLKERGPSFIEGRLRTLHDAVRAVAPHVPLGHANWPMTRQLDLSFMDLACFNLYPSWPREVVVAGYGNYIENTLKPLAAGRPLLITEFGQNTLEATEEKQSQVLRQCWDEIRTRTAGGFVFSFADEWWKNYDNPVANGEWWQREYAPDDERTHDLDPEEYYGIVTSERAPKPAFEAVRAMYSEPATSSRHVALLSLPLLAVLGYSLFVFSRRPRD
jgi:cellulose synthase/poly-beta-1,6-N-acetylglucosamine synthase-like glycosyltransferase